MRFKLVLAYVVGCTESLLDCSEGMPLEGLLGANVVLDLSGLPGRIQAFLVRVLVEHLYLLAIHDRRVDVLLVVDEGQWISGQGDAAEKWVVLRHAGVRMSVNFQNASEVPVEVSGNSDLFVSFRQTDDRDKRTVSRIMGLDTDQKARLQTLDVGECVVFTPSGEWKRPYRARTIHVNETKARPGEVREKAAEFLRGLSWKESPQKGQAEMRRPEGRGGDEGTAEQRSAGGEKGRFVSSDATALLQDILDGRFEFSKLTSRFERARIRSGSRQKASMKRLLETGMVRTATLAVGRGRPITLCEPTRKAFEAAGESEAWKKGGRGRLETRAATSLVRDKLVSLKWTVVSEGRLDGVGKQVDLLCHTPLGERVSVEIAGSVEHEVHNALSCLDSGVGRHFVVCLSSGVEKGVLKRFRDAELLACSSKGRGVGAGDGEVGVGGRVFVFSLAGFLGRDSL